MRVLHLNKTAVGGTWAYRQVRELVRCGLDVHIAVPNDGPLVKAYRDCGVHVHLLQCEFPVRRPWQFAELAAEFRHLVRLIEPDLIHSHFVGTTLTMRLALGRNHSVPRVFQVPGPLHLEHPFFRKAEIGTAGRRDYWIASCEWTRARYHLSGIDPARTFLSYYGVDLERFIPESSGALRTSLGSNSEKKIVGLVAYMYAPKRYLGQRRGIKGHEDLIDALALLGRKRSDIIGVFVGGAWPGAENYERALVRYGKKRCGGMVQFLGTRSDIAALYADFDVAVHPSLSENVGGAVESLALGVPTIATNVGGFPDLVIPGSTGWLVEPRRPADLAVAIEEALADREHADLLARAGQSRVKKLFDVRKNAEEVFSIYQQIVELESSRRSSCVHD